jgi:hypothetical protein
VVAVYTFDMFQAGTTCQPFHGLNPTKSPPTGVIVIETPVLVAVAACESTTEVALVTETMVVELGIPVPVIAAPTSEVLKDAVALVTVVVLFRTPSVGVRAMPALMYRVGPLLGTMKIARNG